MSAGIKNNQNFVLKHYARLIEAVMINSVLCNCYMKRIELIVVPLRIYETLWVMTKLVACTTSMVIFQPIFTEVMVSEPPMALSL